jgi:NACHT domain
MMFDMERGRLYTVAILGLLVTLGVLAWRALSRTSAGTFDPVAAVIGLVTLGVSVAAFRLAARAQQQSDADVAAVARRLARAIRTAETEARRQLLGGHDRAIDAQFIFHPATYDAAGASIEGTLEGVVAYYRKLRPRRMVITGAAGSGKTVLAVELIIGLLDGRAEDAPVPVRMSAALLDTSRPPESAVADWLVMHLEQAFGLSYAAARHLVDERMVLPVLDGLDEMDAIEEPGYASRAGQAIRACNAYLDGGRKAAMVLTCRISQYEALKQAGEWVADAAHIQLQPLEVSAARSFLTQRVTDKSRWQPVLNQLRRPGNRPLAKALSTPWRLALAAAVYEQRDLATGSYLRDPAELAGSGLDTEDKVGDHLLGLFISAAMAAHRGRYTDYRVHRWLGELAGYLNTNTASTAGMTRVIAHRAPSGTDLILHELWPLAGRRMPRVLTAGLMAAIWLGYAAFLLTHVRRFSTSSAEILAVTALVIFAIGTTGYAWTAWPNPRTLDFRQLQTSSGRRNLVGWLLAGLLLGLASGIAFGVVFGPAAGLASGFVLGFVLGPVVGLAFGLSVEAGKFSAAEPGQIIRAALTFGLVFGPAVGLVFGFAGGLASGRAVELEFGVADGLAFGLVAVLAFGLVGWRYVVLLLCTRRWNSRWLPWRLTGFLHWCYQAGLIRIAGIGYQFRHRELQDYLARNPVPPS